MFQKAIIQHTMGVRVVHTVLHIPLAEPGIAGTPSENVHVDLIARAQDMRSFHVIIPSTYHLVIDSNPGQEAASRALGLEVSANLNLRSVLGASRAHIRGFGGFQGSGFRVGFPVLKTCKSDLGMAMWNP